MTIPQALEERITPLEYAVFEQFPATVAAMTHGTTLIYAETVANGEAIAGLRVDMTAMQTSFHREVCYVRGDVAGLKAAIDLQGDSLRKELAVATASPRRRAVGPAFGGTGRPPQGHPETVSSPREPRPGPRGRATG